MANRNIDSLKLQNIVMNHLGHWNPAPLDTKKADSFRAIILLNNLMCDSCQRPLQLCLCHYICFVFHKFVL